MEMVVLHVWVVGRTWLDIIARDGDRLVPLTQVVVNTKAMILIEWYGFDKMQKKWIFFFKKLL